MTTIHFLGTGTSIGVPEIGCHCSVCTSKNSKDKRLRTSIIVENQQTRLLLDCGPDFRQQIMHLPFRKIDAVLISHEHYDHLSGLDDLRGFCQFGSIPIYAQPQVCQTIEIRMPYVFSEHHYPGAPNLELHPTIEQAFNIGSFCITPIEVMHGTLPIYGYRVNDIAYLTDMSLLPTKQIEKLQNLEVLIIDALRIKPHPTHATLEQALQTIELLKPKKSYLIHLSHHFGKHNIMSHSLPPHVHIAYDQLKVNVND